MGNTLASRRTRRITCSCPFSQATLQLDGSADLLQGFRPSVTTAPFGCQEPAAHFRPRFQEQVMATVANVVSLYWDLVTDNEDLKVKQHTYGIDKKLYEDNQRRASWGPSLHRHHSWRKPR